MIPTSPAVAVRVGPLSRPPTDLDRYVRNEFADRAAAWMLPRPGRPNQSAPRRREPKRLDRLLSRAAQTVMAIFF